jgi:hypothetical protein
VALGSSTLQLRNAGHRDIASWKWNTMVSGLSWNGAVQEATAVLTQVCFCSRYGHGGRVLQGRAGEGGHHAVLPVMVWGYMDAASVEKGHAVLPGNSSVELGFVER